MRRSGQSSSIASTKSSSLIRWARNSSERSSSCCLKSVEKLLAERQITLELTPAAEELILREGYDPAYGARPLRRTIQRMIQDPLALLILEGKVLPGQRIRVDRDASGEKMQFTVVAEKQPAAAA